MQIRFVSKTMTFIFILGTIFVVLFFLRLSGIYDPIQSSALRAMQPVYNVFYRAGNIISSSFGQPSDYQTLEIENNSLKNEIVDLKLRITDLESAKQENISLRQLLDYFEEEASDLPKSVARVVGRDQENASILLLNIGRRDGVEINNAVVVQDGVIIAKIIKVFARSSKALLLTDSESRLAVTISGSAPTSKLANGERGLSIILDQIPQGELINRGQLVISSGLESTIPRGLIVGEVEEIISEPNDLFQRAILRPIIDYSTVYFVSVILSPPE